MLSEPLSITYNSVAESFRRVSFGNTNGTSPAEFVTSDGEFRVTIRETQMVESVRFEVSLERTEQDNDSDPFNKDWAPYPNSVGLVFEVNKLRYNSATDLPLLQSALLSWCDATIRGRIVAGEK